MEIVATVFNSTMIFVIYRLLQGYGSNSYALRIEGLKKVSISVCVEFPIRITIQ